ncbi:MAG: hypothetical protein J6M47_04595 [Clostridia bacterium]|nr:hypothetical protein [Clostridia bacterium]
MIRRLFSPRLPAALALCLLIPAAALADPSPAVQALGSARAAEHLAAHIYAYSCGFDGESPAPCTDTGCPEYGHVRCCGRRVRLWDTPAKGTSRVPYYPGGTSAMVGPDTQFQLVNVVSYKGGQYACIRVEHEGHVILSGFINADYVACDCAFTEGFAGWESLTAFEPVEEYVHDVGSFSLK